MLNWSVWTAAAKWNHLFYFYSVLYLATALQLIFFAVNCHFFSSKLSPPLHTDNTAHAPSYFGLTVMFFFFFQNRYFSISSGAKSSFKTSLTLCAFAAPPAVRTRGCTQMHEEEEKILIFKVTKLQNGITLGAVAQIGHSFCGVEEEKKKVCVRNNWLEIVRKTGPVWLCMQGRPEWHGTHRWLLGGKCSPDISGF